MREALERGEWVSLNLFGVFTARPTRDTLLTTSIAESSNSTMRLPDMRLPDWALGRPRGGRMPLPPGPADAPPKTSHE